jgi:hypothetical protein
MTAMMAANAHSTRTSPRHFGTGSLDMLLLRERCVHGDGVAVSDHRDPHAYHLEYALIGVYVTRCEHLRDHAVKMASDWVERDAIEDHYRIRYGQRFGVHDVDIAYWLIDMALVDWTCTCD